MKQAAMAAAAEYTWSNAALQYEQIFTELGVKDVLNGALAGWRRDEIRGLYDRSGRNGRMRHYSMYKYIYIYIYIYVICVCM